MATPRIGTKGKRMLPNIPQVNFNSETIETSIGGTQTPGRLKGDPLSPMNRLSSDETSLRSENSTSPLLDESGCERSSNGFEKVTPLRVNSLVDTSKSNGNVSVAISVTSNNESDKENFPNSPRDSGDLIIERTPVKGNFHLISNGNEDIASVKLYTPSPNMRVRHTSSMRRHTLDEKLLGTPECYTVVHLDKNRYDFGYSDARTDDGEDSCSVTVAVRVRPFSQREISDPNVRNVVTICGNETKVKADSGFEHRFAYDFSFSSFDVNDPYYVCQEKVYRSLAQPLLGKAFEGYNTCLFAYGQTGSGKSYCIMGHGEDTGIIPRFCEELFSRADVARGLDKVKLHVEISFFEIYNEKIHDLLASSNKEKKVKKATLRVREHPTLGPYVEGLSTFVVNSFDDVKGWITLGNKNRATAATGMNDKSSRSHSVFTIVLTQTKTDILEGQEHDHSITSKINLVDLAGSERQSHAQTSGERLREGANINKSLLTLGKVISQLAEQSSQTNKRKKIFIPYRDSVLTWLLKESLGGNSKTAMIATISPANHHTDETLSTLRYAQTARSIVNIARVNEDPKAKLIRELRAEIERLRASGLSGNEDVTSACMLEIVTLKDKLRQKETEMEEITKSWQERLRLSEERKLEEAKQLEKAGVTLKVDNKLPNLVNLNEDPQLSEMLLYNIKEGVTKVGRMGQNSKHDIQLNGALIADNHCIINNIDTAVTITPIGDAPTYVNGNLISEPATLHHGDRVILGGDHYFRFNHPIEVQQYKKNKTSSQNVEIKDFDYAQAELMRVQEARLQEARQRAQEEMLEEVEKAKKDAEKDAESKLADLEKLMREENAEKVKEHEDVIHKLKKQKMMLEQEVIAGRKRQQLEAEAATKASNQLVSERSKIIEMLQAQKEKEAQKLEELKQRWKEYTRGKQVKSPTPNIVEVSAGKTDLYKIALQVREANKISQYLKKNTVFTREDFLDGEEVKTVIKVNNTKLNVCTHWSLSKFEEKLMQMRDIYQNDSESTDEDEVFNDPEDQWGKDSTSMSPRSPKNGQRHSVPSPSLRQALLSSISSVNSSLFRKDSLIKGDTCAKCSGPGVASLCKDILNVTLSTIKSSTMEESIADKILHSCQSLNASLHQTSNLPVSRETNNNQASRTDLLQLICIQMTNSFHVLLNNTTLWASMYQSLQSALIQDLLQRIGDQVKNMGGHIVRFMQGCEGDIDSLIEESTSRLSDSIHHVCKLAGELALATDTPMLYFDDNSSQTGKDGQVTTEVSQSFFSGCETFIDKTLQGALRTVDDFETKAQMLTDAGLSNMALGDVPQNVEICVTTCKDLLLKCQKLQVEVDMSNLEQSFHGSLQYCTGSYRRCEALISHVSALVEGVGMLVQNAEPIIEGRDFDIRKLIKCAEMIRKYSVSVTEVTTRDVRKTSTTKGDNSNDEQSPSLSDTVVEQLQFTAEDVQQSINSLVDSVQKVIELDRASGLSTPRSKRLLPSPGSVPARNISKAQSDDS
ncbi:kinesin-like protein KIF14 [Ruditapes philippinarum]|uniref:kinesin-like protein KIF14 n=1 Tax=Ruditapes philippinarum TaxID=129788 RepID=UPI00295B83EE|nr:kinesin-like protein KIF14 [Ruditapes philippinarum]